MKSKFTLIAAVIGIVSSAPASAQVLVDMSLITCGQFLTSDADRKVMVASWMSGYFSASKNLSSLDFRYLDRNTKVIGKYCGSHKSETLMSAIQKNGR